MDMDACIRTLNKPLKQSIAIMQMKPNRQMEIAPNWTWLNRMPAG